MYVFDDPFEVCLAWYYGNGQRNDVACKKKEWDIKRNPSKASLHDVTYYII